MKQIPIVNKSPHPLPAYQTQGASGMDVLAWLPEGSVTIPPRGWVGIPTGLYIAIPDGCEVQVRPRSGLAFKHGVTVLNAPGTIDSDYRGELRVLLINHSAESFEVQDGMRIAQLVLATVTQAAWQETTSLDTTTRGSGGFGHTGL